MALFLASALCAGRLVAQTPADVWSVADSIRARIKAPDFPKREFVVTQFGAKGNGVFECTAAFKKAIEKCAKKGGGRVVVPKGEYLVGRIYLKSNVNLHLAGGAVIKFHRDPKKYLPVVFTRWEGIELMNYSPFVYAFEETNIAITGSGTLDGQASNEYWWSWSGKDVFGWKEGMPKQKPGRDKLLEMGEKNVPVNDRVFGEGYYLRPNFIQPYRSKNILIEGVKILNSPMWEIHPVLCENVTVRNVHIDTHGPNNDGVDPESCKDVLIENCYFNTGDDCIAIKSGRNNDGRRLNTPSQNIVVQGCMFKDGHGAVTIGSEISGGARNVFAEKCEVESPILYNALRIKSNAVRGGLIENVYVRDFNVKLVDRAAIDIDLFYEEGKNGQFYPTIRNIGVERMTVKSGKVAFNLVGYEEAPLQNVWLRDCRFEDVPKGYKVEHVKEFKAERTFVNGKEITP
ncbi:MAG: glycoside hydrolase family 28 protein [Ignavibacteriae bacterium]|nr:glycoside hydrolase family 28 protein [Ignavibacteriota bacterium]